jgi:hypothetical protein
MHLWIPFYIGSFFISWKKRCHSRSANIHNKHTRLVKLAESGSKSTSIEL